MFSVIFPQTAMLDMIWYIWRTINCSLYLVVRTVNFAAVLNDYTNFLGLRACMETTEIQTKTVRIIRHRKKQRTFHLL